MSATTPVSNDSFKCLKTLTVGSKTYVYFSLPDAEANGLKGVSKLPFSMKVLLENLLRHEDGRSVTKTDIENMVAWLNDKGKAGNEIGFRPARVLMQDFTGVPAVVDLAAMRDGMALLKGDPKKINPLVPVDLVIDHSVIVDEFGSPMAFARNVELGQAVVASFQAPNLFTIAEDLSKMQVLANVDEADIGFVQVGAVAQFAGGAPGSTRME